MNAVAPPWTFVAVPRWDITDCGVCGLQLPWSGEPLPRTPPETTLYIYELNIYDPWGPVIRTVVVR